MMSISFDFKIFQVYNMYTLGGIWRRAMFPDIIIKLNKFLEKLSLDSYVLLIAIGILVLIKYIIYSLEIKEKFTRSYTNKIIVISIISLVVSYISAAFFDAYFHYLDNGVFSGGITYISGFLGGIITFILLLYFYLNESKVNIMKLLNIIIPGIILAHAIGRLGCFSVGSCYGQPTSSFLGVYFPEGTNPYIDGIREPIHPTQLYEAVFLIFLFFILQFISKLKKYRFALYLITYGIFRAFLEIFFRGDNRGVLLGMPPSLFLSLILIIIGMLLLFIIYQSPNESSMKGDKL